VGHRSHQVQSQMLRCSNVIDCDPEDYDISALPPEALLALEADTFWCLSKLLDGIQDNYIFAQPGIHRQVARCQELCARVDGRFRLQSEDNVSRFDFTSIQLLWPSTWKPRVSPFCSSLSAGFICYSYGSCRSIRLFGCGIPTW